MRAVISTPSWVIPGTYLENLRFLEDKKDVSGVELLFFFYDDGVQKELDAEFDEIVRYKRRFFFTAHLPDKILPQHEELVEKLRPHVRHFIVHPARNGTQKAVAALLDDWFCRFGQKIFLIENTGIVRFNELLALLPSDTGLCMDTGHLLIEGGSPHDFAAKYGRRIKEMHLHHAISGLCGDDRLPDHRSLDGNAPWFLDLWPFLKDFRGTVNIEVFSWEEVRKSLEVIDGYGRGEYSPSS
jgi:hypothetical protein